MTFLLPILIALAQNPQPTREQLEADRAAALKQQQEMEESRKIFDRMAEQQLHPPRMPQQSSNSARERQRFFQSVPEFRAATEKFRESMGLQPEMTRQVKEIEKLIDPVRDYFNSLKVKGKGVDLSEFTDLSPKDLAWETLTLAETVDNNLQVARRMVQQSDRSGVVDIKTLEFFADVQDDLTRLRFLTSKLVRR